MLHPGEILIAPNPEFMIEGATPRLGAGHPALIEARSLLSQERFLESLLVVREGLPHCHGQSAGPMSSMNP